MPRKRFDHHEVTASAGGLFTFNFPSRHIRNITVECNVGDWGGYASLFGIRPDGTAQTLRRVHLALGLGFIKGPIPYDDGWREMQLNGYVGAGEVVDITIENEPEEEIITAEPPPEVEQVTEPWWKPIFGWMT